MNYLVRCARYSKIAALSFLFCTLTKQTILILFSFLVLVVNKFVFFKYLLQIYYCCVCVCSVV